MRPTIICDVNETLLDLEPIRAEFGRIYGDRTLATAWFGVLLKLAFVATIADTYRPFPELAGAAFDMVAASRRSPADPRDRARVVEAMATLPPHPDAGKGLRMLREAGFRIGALTNSPQAIAQRQLGNAGLADYFEQIMSVEVVGAFKPARATYRAAVEALGIAPQDAVLVAAHDWDIAGAMAAGLRGGFVARAGQVLSPLQPRPEYVAPDVAAVAAEIIADHSRG